MTNRSVNLLFPAAGASVNPSGILREIRTIATVVVAVFVVVALSSFGFHLYIQAERTRSKDQETQLVKNLITLSKVDALQHILISRVGMLMNIAQKQPNVAQNLGIVGSIAPWHTITAYSFGQDGQAILRFAPLEFPDAAALGAKLLDLTAKARISNAQFSQLGLDSNGKVLVQLSFMPK